MVVGVWGEQWKEVNIQRRPVLIKPRNQQRHPKRPTHDTLLALGALPKPQRQIANRLRTALHPQRLCIVERVVLRLHARVLDHRPGVGLQPAHGAADVSVYLDDLFDGAGFEEGGGDALFDAEDDAFGGGDLGYLVSVWS